MKIAGIENGCPQQTCKSGKQIEDMSFAEIIDYLLYERQQLVLPSNSKSTFEEFTMRSLTTEDWKQLVSYITKCWYQYGDEGFIDDLLINELNLKIAH
jgi:hypothetical protein